MSLQSIIDLSNSLNINRRKLVGVQYTRSQLPKTDLTVTKNPWRFTVEVPGLPWYKMRSIIENLDHIDRYVPQTISFANNPKIAWMFRYQGDYPVIPTSLTVTSFTGTQLTVGNVPSMTLGSYLFRAGDLIQISDYPFPFTVVNNVQYTGASAVITTHRPNIINGTVSGKSVIVGSGCQFYMFAAEMPTYTITPGARVIDPSYQIDPSAGIINNGIVTFDGGFQLYEYLS